MSSMKLALPPAMTERESLLAALAGLLGAAAFPPVGLWPLCLPAVAYFSLGDP